MSLVSNGVNGRDQESVAGNSPRARDAWLPWLTLGVLWLPLFWRLSFAWNSGVEHLHGWAVPLVFVYFIRERLRHAPESSPGGGKPSPWALSVLFLGGLVLALSLPLLEANRLWPTLQWFVSAAAIAASLAALVLAGGWRWGRHFLFPLCFLTTALSWPAALQATLLDRLSGLNASVAAELVSLFGYPALARGNTIEVGLGIVGIDEACSGLRSLEAVWMLSWLLGEALSLAWFRRIALVSLGLAVALVGNLLRTSTLACRIASAGTAAGEQWHDAAGNIAMVATLLIVVLLACRFDRGRSVPAAKHTSALPRLPRFAFIVVLLVMLTGEVGTRAWYAAKSSSLAGVQWQLSGDASGWTRAETPAREQQILGAAAAEKFAWTAPVGSLGGLAFVFRWEDDSIAGWLGSRYHDPTICMPLMGAVKEAEPAPLAVEIDGRQLSIQRLRFAAAGTKQHIFSCIWDADAAVSVPPATLEIDMLAERWRFLREGRSRANFARIIFVLQGSVSEAEAEAWFLREAPKILKRR